MMNLLVIHSLFSEIDEYYIILVMNERLRFTQSLWVTLKLDKPVDGTGALRLTAKEGKELWAVDVPRLETFAHSSSLSDLKYIC